MVELIRIHFCRGVDGEVVFIIRQGEEKKEGVGWGGGR